MKHFSSGEKALIAATLALGMAIGIRSEDSILLGALYGVGLLLPAVFIFEMLAFAVSRNTAAFVVAALTAIGVYKVVTGPSPDRAGGGADCVEVDRFGTVRCK